MLRVTQDTGEPGLGLEFLCLQSSWVSKVQLPFCGLDGLVYALFPRAFAQTAAANIPPLPLPPFFSFRAQFKWHSRRPLLSL